MSYWLKWDWEHQCNFCKNRKLCAQKDNFKQALKNIKTIFENDPATIDSTMSIDCNKFSVDQRRYDEYIN